MSHLPSDQAAATVLQALHTLYHDPESAAKRRASEWLEEFQHSAEAWQTCHSLLTSPSSPPESRLFAAQSFRAKILYDLPQLPRESLAPLRDSLIASLAPLTQPSAPAGSRAVLIQLCLALSDLALQMPEWTNVVGGMIDQFGKDPSTVTVLLGFLRCLVEEFGNPRIPLSSEEARSVMSDLAAGSADQVIGVLGMYIQASGVTTAIQISVYETLRSWLQAGEVMSAQIIQTPLFHAAFEALSSDQLFDSAVDVITQLIHETLEVQDNVEVIQQIVPRLVALRPQLDIHKDDPDRIRGYCRMFCEAGETYHELIARHPADLIPLVGAIAACAAYPDLDIVPITFNFWYTLAEALGRMSEQDLYQPLLDIYVNLQTVIISHLHFPRDDEEQSAEERDEFRIFRHRMGDTLKDCCHVLGAPACLKKSYDLVIAALAKPSPSWQEIEAPLFSMRSMGAEVDPDDDEVLPRIMDMLPSLPDHPRIRYAAILVISRYTQWIDRHPANLAFQLQYISAGFDMAEEEVSAAAAQAMKFMCQDCNQHLVPFLPELHQFVTSVGGKLHQSDMVEVSEAIGYVISDMPSETAAPALQQFCEPLIQLIQAAAASPTEASKHELDRVSDALEQIDAYLSVIKRFEPFPESCLSTCTAVYSILDNLLARYARTYHFAERVGSLLRRGLVFFPPEALRPVIQPLMERMALAFEETGYATFLWITGKSVSRFGDFANGPGGEELAALLVRSFERTTAALGQMLAGQTAVEIPDVVDDYAHCLMAYLTGLPQAVLSSPSLPQAFSHTLASLVCPSTETVLICLDVLGRLSNLLPQYHQQLQPIFAQYGQVLLGLVINGVIQGYPEDGLDSVKEIFGATVGCVSPQEAQGWMQEIMNGIPGHVVPASDKQVFLGELHDHLQAPGSDRLKNALNNLVRAARRARDRGRQSRKSLGTGV
ncbi:transportin-3, partial [Tremellales sp. Uapishka_1]